MIVLNEAGRKKGEVTLKGRDGEHNISNTTSRMDDIIFKGLGEVEIRKDDLEKGEEQLWGDGKRGNFKRDEIAITERFCNQ